MNEKELEIRCRYSDIGGTLTEEKIYIIYNTYINTKDNQVEYLIENDLDYKKWYNSLLFYKEGK